MGGDAAPPFEVKACLLIFWPEVGNDESTNRIDFEYHVLMTF